MTDISDAEFYANREKQELALAKQASNPAIARIHLDLAEHYASRIRATERDHRINQAARSTLHLGTKVR